MPHGEKLNGNCFFSASMMCANYGNLQQEVEALEEAGIDRFHIDVMDGQFVSNFGMGRQDIEFIRKATKKPLEFHLMVEKPERYINLFADLGADVIFIHPESERQPATTLEIIREKGVRPGLVISPNTPVESVEGLFYIAPDLLVMGVSPGHAGQMYMPYIDRKLQKLLRVKDEYNLVIEMDGACTAGRVQDWHTLGVAGYVLGTAALFKQKNDADRSTYKQTIRELRAITGRSEP